MDVKKLLKKKKARGNTWKIWDGKKEASGRAFGVFHVWIWLVGTHVLNVLL